MSTPNAESGLHPDVGMHPNDAFKAAFQQLQETGNTSDELGASSTPDQPRNDDPPREESGDRSESKDGLKDEENLENGEEDQGRNLENEGQDNVDGKEGTGEGEDIETIMAGGRELEINWKDKDQLRVAVQKAVAYKQAKLDKDQALNQVKEKDAAILEMQGSLDNYKEEHSKIREAKNMGPEAVLKLLFGRDISDFQAEWKERAGWSDEKREAFDEKLKSKQLETRIKAMEESAKEREENAKKLEEKAALREVESHFNSSYRKYSLDGVFGDPEIEDMFDDQMYNEVKSQFNSKDLSEISASDIESAFKLIRSKYLRIAKKQGDDKLNSDIDRKKKEALRSAQSRAASKAPRRSVQDAFKEASMSKDGWKTILSNPELRSQL